MYTAAVPKDATLKKVFFGVEIYIGRRDGGTRYWTRFSTLFVQRYTYVN